MYAFNDSLSQYFKLLLLVLLPGIPSLCDNVSSNVVTCGEYITHQSISNQLTFTECLTCAPKAFKQGNTENMASDFQQAYNLVGEIGVKQKYLGSIK